MDARPATASATLATRAAFRLELWLRARLLPLRLAGHDTLAGMLALAEPAAGRRHFAGLPAAYVVRAVRRTLRHRVVMRGRPCLREGLLAYRFLAEAGYRPQLHFGVDPGIVASDRAVAHCWVTLDGATVIGGSQIPYVEIHVHPGGIGSAPRG
ncbi:MAG: hypothetical protein BGN87_09265 [Rhizobiales bacterium 65-79]|jgi:hypothetical protein|nr:lasso peptide biosynthesis B2 protein [Hyphomicrobiales bacterium]OJU02380.1 MAG: hypothetical protein BGN87_09265 [Rhizobiales bacterium 65-79]